MTYEHYNDPIALDEALTIAHQYVDLCRAGNTSLDPVDVLEELGYIPDDEDYIYTERDAAMAKQIDGLAGMITTPFTDDEIREYAQGHDVIGPKRWYELLNRALASGDRVAVDDDWQLHPSDY